MSEVLIRCDNVSKRFCRDLRKNLWYGVKDIAREVIFDRTGRLPASSADVQLRPAEFWANKDISFEVKRGECLGLIGHNGAGKTTLLKMLNGLIKPDTGRIEMRGKIGALIALGAGFNPILTGRENIFVNGAILGMSKRQIDDRLDEIVDFAELAEFIDTPVRNYSSGMQVRLGFTATVKLFQPVVLLLDEVLAVGDVSFRFKCAKEIAQLRARCATIFVSHDKGLLRQICSSGIALEKGKPLIHGGIDAALCCYERTLQDSPVAANHLMATPLTHCRVEFNSKIAHNECLLLRMELISDHPVDDAFVRLSFYDVSRTLVAEFNTARDLAICAFARGGSCIRIKTGPIFLSVGHYDVDVQLLRSNGIEQLYWSSGEQTLAVTDSPWSKAPCIVS